MSYLLDVAEDSPSAIAWRNFADSWPATELGNFRTLLNRMLEPHKGRDAYGSYLEFDTEEDAIIFVLKYS